MAVIFGRVDKCDWEHEGLFANIVPIYIRGLYTDAPEIVAANGCPGFLLDLCAWLVINLPMPYDGFWLAHIKPIKTQ